MATKIMTCDRCGIEGERGDQPGEGKIVPCGGESALAPYTNGALCDECADLLMDQADRLRCLKGPSRGR